MSIAKKIFIISAVLLSAVLFFMGIYNLSFKNKTANNTASNEPKAVSQSSEDKSITEKISEKIGLRNKDKIYSVSNSAVIAPVIFGEDKEKIKYYSRLNGTVYEVNLDGSGEKTIDDNNFTGLENILWSADANKVISIFNNAGKFQYSTYDYQTKKASKLADGASNAVWNNMGAGIVYKYTDGKTRKMTLNTANADGSNWKKIADVSLGNTIVSTVPQSSVVSFWNAPSAFEETSLYVVSALGGDPRKIFSGHFGTDYLWSPNGTKVLISSVDLKGGSKMSLGSINANGGELHYLNVPTFASKCAWSKDNKTVYYALPSFPSGNYVLPDDYQNKKISSADTFWKIDISTGKAERIADIQDIKDSFDATNLFLSSSEDILFFINRTDGKLYGINL